MSSKRMQVGQKKASDDLSLELWATMGKFGMNLGLLNDHQVPLQLYNFLYIKTYHISVII